MTNKVQLTLGYEGTDFTRNVTISGVSDDDVDSVKNKILALNASLAGGTSGGLDTFLRSDDYNSDSGVGTFQKITAAKVVSTQIDNINLDEEGE